MQLQKEKKALRSVSDQMAQVILNNGVAGGVKREAGDDEADGGEKRMRHGSEGAWCNEGMCPPSSPPAVANVGDAESEYVVPNIDVNGVPNIDINVMSKK